MSINLLLPQGLTGQRAYPEGRTLVAFKIPHPCRIYILYICCLLILIFILSLDALVCT